MGEGDPPVYDQALDLEEHRRVGRIGRLPAVDFPRDDDSDRRLALLHDPDLNGRGVGPQQQVAAEIKCVPVVPGGMVRGEIEGFEIIIIGLDLRPVLDSEAHLFKDRLDLPLENPERMGRPPSQPLPGEGWIDLRAPRGRTAETLLESRELLLDFGF